MTVYARPLSAQEVEAKMQESKACLKKERGWGAGETLVSKVYTTQE